MPTMTYRKLDSNGDYTFGQGINNFYVDQIEGVAQAIITRLKLFQGEWFINTSAGTPYKSEIIGMGKIPMYDRAIQQVIKQTQGVIDIISYSSAINSVTRTVEINCTVTTLYGQTTIGSTI